jgi:hypothetical protein
LTESVAGNQHLEVVLRARCDDDTRLRIKHDGHGAPIRAEDGLDVPLFGEITTDAQGGHIFVRVECLKHPAVARGNRHRAAAERDGVVEQGTERVVVGEFPTPLEAKAAVELIARLHMRRAKQRNRCE